MSVRRIVASKAGIGALLVIAVASMALIAPRALRLPLSPARTSATSTPAGISAASTPTAAPPGLPLLVRDRHLVTADGHSVILVGVSHSSLEYSCKGDGHFQPADFQAMRAWGLTVVRIPLWSRYWLNLDGLCASYQQTVSAAVANAEAANLYVILDLQWTYTFATGAFTNSNGNPNYQFPMPDNGEALQFWQQVAARYHSDPRVLFDLYGEPNAVTWQTWYAGGSITTPGGTYQAIGMRALVDAVRSIAPATVIIISGLNWGYDLSAVGTLYSFPEPDLLFGTHPFDYSNKQPWDYDRAFGQTATRVAVIGAEFGAYDCSTGYIAATIAYFNQHQIPWLAWTWAPYGCGTPSLLSSWSGSPSQPYGAFIQRAALALHATTS